VKQEADDLFRVLVADDEQAMRQAYADVLAVPCDDPKGADLADLETELFGKDSAEPYGSNLSLTVCRQGDEALAAVRQACSKGQPYSVAFLDVRMPPGPSGVEVASEIRAIDPDINLVLVTGYSDVDPRKISEIVPPAEKLFYVTKPFHRMDLQQFAAALTNKWAAERDLQEAHRELMRNYVKLESAHHELVDAKHRAEAASRAKSEFLANMSHEFRTPLNAIMGFGEIFRNETLGPLGCDKYREYAQDIVEGGSRLLQIINDILDLSDIEAEKMVLNESGFSVRTVFDRVLADLRNAADASGVRLEAGMDAGLPELWTDERRLNQILVNLLSNAIRFTPSGGTVSLTAHQDAAGDIEISLRDNGVGMCPAHVETALEPFGQVDGGFDRKHEGLGLGLPLSRSLTDRLGGTLCLESELGAGTTVTLRFPGHTVVADHRLHEGQLPG